MITEDWARQQIEGLLPRLEMAKAQAAEAERKIAGIREIIRGVLIMYPELAEEVPDDPYLTEQQMAPKGADAIRLILREVGGQFTVSMMVDDLRSRHWLPASDNPANPVRTALERLVVAGEVHKHAGTSPVRYQLIERAET